MELEQITRVTAVVFSNLDEISKRPVQIIGALCAREREQQSVVAFVNNVAIIRGAACKISMARIRVPGS